MLYYTCRKKESERDTSYGRMRKARRKRVHILRMTQEVYVAVVQKELFFPRSQSLLPSKARVYTYIYILPRWKNGYRKERTLVDTHTHSKRAAECAISFLLLKGYCAFFCCICIFNFIFTLPLYLFPGLLCPPGSLFLSVSRFVFFFFFKLCCFYNSLSIVVLIFFFPLFDSATKCRIVHWSFF